MSDLLRPSTVTAAAGDPGRSRNLQRLQGVVIARGGAEIELEIGRRRWSGRSEAPLPEVLRPGARVTLEGVVGAGSGIRPVRLHPAAGPPIDLGMRPRPGPRPEQPAAVAKGAPPIAVTVRPVDGGTPPLKAHLIPLPSAPVPQRGGGAPFSAADSPAPGGRAAPGTSIASDRAGHRAGSARTAGAAEAGPLDRRAYHTVPGGDADPVLDAEVALADRAGRIMLRIGRLLLRVQEPLHLPPGARVQLMVPRPIAMQWAIEQSSARPGTVPEVRAVPKPGGDRPQALRPDETLAGRLLEVARRLALADRGQEPARTARGERAGMSPAELVGQVRDPVGGWFRHFDLPFGPDMLGLRVHVRVDEDPDERSPARAEADEEQPRRAIVAVDFERLGPCQLDVLCQAGRFDLQVRSQRSLPESTRRAIAELFIAARDAAGLDGALQFAPGELVRFEAVGPPGESFEV